MNERLSNSQRSVNSYINKLWIEKSNLTGSVIYYRSDFASVLCLAFTLQKEIRSLSLASTCGEPQGYRKKDNLQR